MPLQALAGSLGSTARLGSRCQLKDPWARPQGWRRSSEADRLRQVCALDFHSTPRLYNASPLNVAEPRHTSYHERSELSAAGICMA